MQRQCRRQGFWGCSLRPLLPASRIPACTHTFYPLSSNFPDFSFSISPLVSLPLSSLKAGLFPTREAGQHER